MALTEHGISTTTERDSFKCESYKSISYNSSMVQWDYRTSKGELFSGVAKTEEAAKATARKFGYKG